MKYLVVKGWLGFGDRIESLKMCIHYALKFNLKIYVDWTDSMWSHGSEDFYKYFRLENIDTINSLDDIPDNATFYPPVWTKETIKTSITLDFITTNNVHIGILSDTFEADVLVVSNVGNRSLFADSKFFTNVVKVRDTRIIEKVTQRINSYPVKTSWGIHIRGTDKVADRKRIYSIQSLVSLITNYGGLNGKSMILVGDDKQNVELWKRFYPQSIVLSELSLQQSSKQGNHNVDKTNLTFTKDELNVDMLVDFFTLAYSERVFSTSKDSRFANEAIRLHPYIDMML